MPISYLLQGAALGLTAGASPGPLQTFLINQSLSGGMRRGAPVALAPLITDLPIILLSLFVLNRLPAYFLRLVGLAGGLFVLYLAWGLWQSWRAGEVGTVSEEPPQGGSLRQAVIVNFLGPGAYLFWGLVNGPILLEAMRQSALEPAAFLVGFYGVFIASLLALAFLFSQARRFGPRAVRVLVLASIIILVIFGLILLKDSIWG